MSGFLGRRLALTFIAASALWSIQLGTSWAFDQARYPFEDAVEYPSIHLGQIQSSDLNGDGHLDLVGLSGGGLNVATGDGAGAFAAAGTIAPQASQYALGDANGDGLTDIAVRRSDGSGGNEIAVLINDGNGLGFTTTDVIPVSNSTFLWGMARFGSGPDEDLLTLDGHSLTHSNPTTVISVFPGGGDGTFGTPIDSPVGIGPIAEPDVYGLKYVASADLDGDGIRDAVIGATVVGQGTDSFVMKGRPDGHFEGVVQREVFGPRGIAIGDLNGDGLPDLVGLDQGATGQNPNYATNFGGLGFSWRGFLGAATPGSLIQMDLPAIADFDGDGFGDVVGPSNRYQPIGISYGSADGFLTAMDGIARDPSASAVHAGSASGDFNEDGLPDVAAGGGSLGVLLHKPPPAPPPPPPDEGGSGGVLGDVAVSGTGLHVLKHHFPKTLPQLLRNGVTATVGCDVACDLRTRLVAHDGSIKTFHFPGATIARVQTTITAGQVVKVRVRPTGHIAELIASGGASGKRLGYGLRFNSTPAS